MISGPAMHGRWDDLALDRLKKTKPMHFAINLLEAR